VLWPAHAEVSLAGTSSSNAAFAGFAACCDQILAELDEGSLPNTVLQARGPEDKRHPSIFVWLWAKATPGEEYPLVPSMSSPPIRAAWVDYSECSTTDKAWTRSWEASEARAE
jgi:hypothetical protein